ncbi:hypothetical protein K470DRAFT_261362 [Piedraia hortae CBS 480.64]|uniref:PWI domain-containing protein n=1 Tax=Piedraia hortae CBS 480.64 TaxID=1314780 RepID=A0A6A7CAM3_9PEZI|nr:hypothetical protein K470DRAFT_261362 [Piedraia hortae CBS 480.64]
MAFHPPPFDFSAPVIRLGGAQPNDPGGRVARPGLGHDGRNMDRDRAAVRESMMSLQPPTREEVARTIFIGSLSDQIPESIMESILRCAGKLRKWTRVRDADDRPCKFGFAEYEDVEGLEAAAAIFGDGLQIPLLQNGAPVKNEAGELQTANILVVVDEQSKSYIEEWKSRRRETEAARNFRLDSCHEDLKQFISAMGNASALAARTDMGDDTIMRNGEADIVTIPLTLEDELADIPAEQRAQVAAEIRAFRDRSNRRDQERLRREEEFERGRRPSSPHLGPSGAPSGPRGQQVAGAPSGPKSYRGVQIPSDYQNGVSFVAAGQDEDAEESDEELERRREAKRREELEKRYNDAERRRQNRERTRAMAQQRESEREEAEEAENTRRREALARRLRNFDDDEELRSGHEEYYYDRSNWQRKRDIFREREERQDERDREQEARETAQPTSGKAAFKISLGSAAAKTRAARATAPKRSTADVEGLLEDEEDAAASGRKRPELKPLPEITSDLTDEEKASAHKALASEIPTDTATLFAWPIRWNHLTSKMMEEQIRPFVEKKVVEYLGINEDLLVDAIVDGLRERRDAKDLVEEVRPALEEEAELLVKKVWRLAVFWSEAKFRGWEG